MPITENDHKEESARAGKKVLFYFIAFFLVFAAVDIFFVYKALQSNTGIVVENPYQVGVQYNDIIEKAREEKAANDKNQPGTGNQE